jgi:hypothetical protein
MLRKGVAKATHAMCRRVFAIAAAAVGVVCVPSSGLLLIMLVEKAFLHR